MLIIKRILTALCVIGACSISLHAQVTIGSGLSPREGTLLDLKEFEDNGNTKTSDKGLLLPRVKLIDVKPDNGKLAESISGQGSWAEKSHIGLIVYNVFDTKTPEYKRGAYPGIYIWDGVQWLPIYEKKPKEPEEEITDEFIGANCYILATGGKTIEIPAKRGLDIWQMYNGNDKSNGKVLDISILGLSMLSGYTTEIIWQETNDASASDVISKVEIEGSLSEPILKVTSGSKTGNALVAIASGSTGEIIWMWHIWVPESDPTINSQMFKNEKGEEYWVMATNLGAISPSRMSYNSNDPSTGAAFGLYYQWGRHIPFRTFSDTPIYIFDTSSSTLAERTTLTYALQNPNFVLYFDVASHDWYSATPNMWNLRWTKKNAQGKRVKSPFDPCPAGWRVPDVDINESAWQGLETSAATQEGSGVNTRAGYFPFAGYLADGNAMRGDVGQRAYNWSADSYLDVNAANLYIENTTVYSKYGMNKANALSVRCVKDKAR